MTTTTQQERTLRWFPVTDPFSAVAGALEITARGRTTTYSVVEFASPFPGRSFNLCSAIGDHSADVFVSHHGPEGDSCTCADAFYRRRACKHVSACRKLMECGKL
jgi:hypothetical protein